MDITESKDESNVGDTKVEVSLWYIIILVGGTYHVNFILQ